MKKRLLTVLLCVIMSFVLLSVTVLATEPDTSTDKATTVWIWGQALASADSYYHNGDAGSAGVVNNTEEGANAHYDPTTGLLTLTDLSALGSDSFLNEVGGTYTLYADGDVTMILNGTNRLSTVDNTSETCAALCVKYNLTIGGNGTITCIGGNAITSYGVFVFGNLTVSGGSIRGSGGSCVCDNLKQGNSYGIYTSDGYIGASGGSIEGNGGKATFSSFGVYSGTYVIASNNCCITGTGADAIRNIGIYAGNGDIKADGGSIIGDCSMVQTSTVSYGLYASEDIIAVNSGSLEGISGETQRDNNTTGRSFGIHTDNDITASTDSILVGVGGISEYSCGLITRLGNTSMASSVRAIFRGNTQAFCQPPDAFGMPVVTATIYDGSGAVAAVNYDGSGAVAYNPADWSTYKYFCTTENLSSPRLTKAPENFKRWNAPNDLTATIMAEDTPFFNASTCFGRATIDGSTPIDLGSAGVPGLHGSVTNVNSGNDGSMIIKFNKTYLDSLSEGTHNIIIYLRGLYTGQTVQATLTVAPPPPVSASISPAAVSIPVGDTVTLTATPVNIPNPGYEWYRIFGDVTTPIFGADTNTYTPPTDSESTYSYYCTVYSKDYPDDCDEAVSNLVAVTVTAPPSYDVTLPSETAYTINPESGSASPVVKGNSYSFKVTLNSNYEKSTDFAVKTNGVSLTSSGEIYTIANITAPQTITVEGVVMKDADYSDVNEALDSIPDDLSDYTDETANAVNEARDAVITGKKIDEQTTVDNYATAIKNAVDALEYKDADYSKVNAAIARIPADLTPYTDASVKAVNDAKNAVVTGKKIDEQTAVDNYAAAIKNAVDALEYKDADYSKVNAAIARIPADLTPYTDASVKAVNDAKNAVVTGKKIGEQATVDAYAAAIENAVSSLEEIKSPPTGDTGNMALWIALLFISGSTATVLGSNQKRRKVK